jgi:P4 family phage/plasmid primase-like protien
MTSGKEPSDETLSLALQYIDAGYAVFPLDPPVAGDQDTGKKPKLNAWQHSKLTAREFRRLYKPGDGLGVRCGRQFGLVCVDIDPKNGGDRWFEANKDDLGQPLVERSGQPGGKHLYYRFPELLVTGPEDLLKTDHGVAPGVEFFGDGSGFLVTAPSVHWTGAVYEFERGFTLLDLEEFDELPGWFFNLLRERQARKDSAKRESVTTVDGLVYDLSADVDQAVRYLETKAEQPVAGQGRNNATWRTAAALKNYAITMDTAIELMERHYLPRTLGTPYTRDELIPIVRNGYRYAKSAAGSTSIQTEFPELSDSPPKKIPEEEQTRQEMRALGKLKVLLKRPMELGNTLLAEYADRIKISQDMVYCYSPDRYVWTVLKDAQFRALLWVKLIEQYPEAMQLAKPRNVTEVSQAIRLFLEHEQFDATPNRWLDGRPGNFVRLENGILDIERRELLPHSKDWFSFTKLPYNYDPEVRCPTFESFLDSIWSDDKDGDAKEALRLWLGYLLLSDVREQKFCLLMGASRAGKGVLSRLMQKLIGKENTAAATMSSIANDHGLSQLVDKSLVIFGDVVKASGSSGEIATERLISIIGQDPQVINPKNKDLFTAALPVKVVMACNELPAFVNNRQALSNRMLVFPFTQSFAGKEDPGLEARLEAELPGILNWALVGSSRIIAGERLRMPRCADQAFIEVKKQLDPIYGFISDTVSFTEYVPFDDEFASSFVRLERLYEEYCMWCKANNHMPKAKNRFASAFRAHCPEQVFFKRVNTVQDRKETTFYNVRLEQKDPFPDELN